MTSLPSSSRVRFALRRVSLFVVLAGATFLSACEDKHIGRPCEIGVDMIADPKVATVNPAALECPSRICLLPAQDRTLDATNPTGAFCTDECSGDDDCADGETRGKRADDTRCKEGFVCRRVIPKLESNPLSCKPVCVCRDFLPSNPPNLTPPSCGG
jgi:hypothetical protein